MVLLDDARRRSERCVLCRPTRDQIHHSVQGARVFAEGVRAWLLDGSLVPCGRVTE